MGCDKWKKRERPKGKNNLACVRCPIYCYSHERLVAPDISRRHLLQNSNHNLNLPLGYPHPHQCFQKISLLRVRLLVPLLFNLEQQCAVDVWQDTSKRDGGSDQGIEFLVASNSKLQMTRRDTFDLEVLRGVSSKFEYFGGEVFENGGHVYGSFGTHAHLILGLRFQETLDTTAWELKTRLRRMRLLRLSTVVGARFSTSLTTSLALSACHCVDMESCAIGWLLELLRARRGAADSCVVDGMVANWIVVDVVWMRIPYESRFAGGIAFGKAIPTRF